MDLKYLVMANDEGGSERIFLFPKSIDHDAFAEVVHGVRNQTWGDWKRECRNRVSAGFVTDGVCHGESVTLNLKSRGDADTALLSPAEY